MSEGLGPGGEAVGSGLGCRQGGECSQRQPRMGLQGLGWQPLLWGAEEAGPSEFTAWQSHTGRDSMPRVPAVLA